MRILILLISVLVIVFSCKTNEAIQSGNESQKNSDYIIQIRSFNQSLPISNVIIAFGDKLTIETIRSNEFNFVSTNQIEIQVIARNISESDLQNLLSSIGRCPGIVEIHHYKMQ